MFRVVWKVVGISLSALCIAFLVTMVCTFVRATGAAAALDTALGTGDATAITQASENMASATSGFFFDLAKGLPVVGPYFASFQGYTGQIQEGVATLGSSVGHMVNSIGNLISNAAGQIGGALGVGQTVIFVETFVE